MAQLQSSFQHCPSDELEAGGGGGREGGLVGTWSSAEETEATRLSLLVLKISNIYVLLLTISKPVFAIGCIVAGKYFSSSFGRCRGRFGLWVCGNAEENAGGISI